MGRKVYANGMEIAAKSGRSRVLAFPDVCLSPPPPPAGPVPVPYPNTSSSSDLKEGSKQVLIGGKPVSLADRSHYKSSPLGDEAATRNFGGSLLTHGITGKTYFGAYSMDVKFEGKNVHRHLDLTTSNHSSYPGSTPPSPSMEGMVQLALDRIREKVCPCCGSGDCPAKFKEGDEPLHFEEYYKLNEPHPSPKAKFKGQLSDRAKQRKGALEKLEAASCTCKPGQRVRPQPPCDVFRAPNSDLQTKIEAAWEEEGVKDIYKRGWAQQFGRPLRSSADVVNELRAAAGGKFANDADITKALDQANKQTRINHLVPKEGGGCPKNPGNLQPQDELCSRCQKIDDLFTKWQG
ncbi:PAAR-like domain-containing protein [Nannocystis radixulma]|uniref:DUF4150 domain-containing protein n=1 Tax=Nannocystis radixulma TaxID=2995305 RepID=A0ABT5B359_9BACT|nr:PAAR-like domain-containing protein [Nannocystis radixulma]MDC0668095.1 DUF4150 domain-containing protein [Nannocystis radixulma]